MSHMSPQSTMLSESPRELTEFSRPQTEHALWSQISELVPWRASCPVKHLEGRNSQAEEADRMTRATHLHLQVLLLCVGGGAFHILHGGGPAINFCSLLG